MKDFIDEEIVKIETSEYKDFTPTDWAMLWIEIYSGIDGAHHKDWVLDQVARILRGTPVIVKIARWKGGKTEDRFSLGEPSKEYWEFVRNCKAGEDGPETYEYYPGIAP